MDIKKELISEQLWSDYCSALRILGIDKMSFTEGQDYKDATTIVDTIIRGVRQKEYTELRLLSTYINSAVISDVLDDMGVNGIISGLKTNIPVCKLFGRAKTLKLRKLKDGEDFKGIYDALESYNHITFNDIIMVENECEEYAYFGELNSTLAIRAGASGAIIGGNTRDSVAVLENGFPVFSKGLSCKDVRCRATVDSMNQPIVINGVNIENNDLIFADVDGIAVIPKAIEEEVIRRIYITIEKESTVLARISKGISGNDIVNEVGGF